MFALLALAAGAAVVAYVASRPSVVAPKPGDGSPIATVPGTGGAQKISPGITPLSPFTPREAAPGSAGGLAGVVPADVFAKVSAILNNYQVSGWRGMTVTDFAYLGQIADAYPAAAPFLAAARQAFVEGYFSGGH